MKNPYMPEKVRIAKVSDETHDTKLFRINSRTAHTPGQFYQLSLPYYGEAPISVCSYSDKHLEFCVRNVGNLTNAMHKLKAGGSLWLRGPYGKGYPVELLEGRNITIVGGGTGTAPVRSAVEYVQRHRKKFGSVDIFLGFRTGDDILFKKDIRAWEKKFRLHLTLDTPCNEWVCSTGFVTALIEQSDIRPENNTVLACGPPVMIKSAINVLEGKGFKDEQIYVSLERLMKCGIRKCGRCMVNSKYVCHDGPVFNQSEARWLKD
ncbi:MAG: FAD/NAD(P)-binding protein [Candidatus Altiarchaeota archaeon]